MKGQDLRQCLDTQAQVRGLIAERVAVISPNFVEGIATW